MRADPNDDAPGDELIVVVRVERTGGIAGLRRAWTAEPPPDDAPRWIELIDGCPWDSADDGLPARGADRYQWRIVARLADEPPRRAEMPDDRLEGPWRELVDEVRAFHPRTEHTPRPAPIPDTPPPTQGAAGSTGAAAPEAGSKAAPDRVDPTGLTT